MEQGNIFVHDVLTELGNILVHTFSVGQGKSGMHASVSHITALFCAVGGIGLGQVHNESPANDHQLVSELEYGHYSAC